MQRIASSTDVQDAARIGVRPRGGSAVLWSRADRRSWRMLRATVRVILRRSLMGRLAALLVLLAGPVDRPAYARLARLRRPAPVALASQRWFFASAPVRGSPGPHPSAHLIGAEVRPG